MTDRSERKHIVTDEESAAVAIVETPALSEDDKRNRISRMTVTIIPGDWMPSREVH